MGEVVQLPRCVEQEDTDYLKRIWNEWSGKPNDKLWRYDFESVYWELVRRGEPVEV